MEINEKQKTEKKNVFFCFSKIEIKIGKRGFPFQTPREGRNQKNWVRKNPQEEKLLKQKTEQFFK